MSNVRPDPNVSLTPMFLIVDPVKDLRPVCPNCHAVIHLRGGCLSIEEVQELINNTA